MDVFADAVFGTPKDVLAGAVSLLFAVYRNSLNKPPPPPPPGEVREIGHYEAVSLGLSLL
jgi:hypothetical protein